MSSFTLRLLEKGVLPSSTSIFVGHESHHSWEVSINEGRPMSFRLMPQIQLAFMGVLVDGSLRLGGGDGHALVARYPCPAKPPQD